MSIAAVSRSRVAGVVEQGFGITPGAPPFAVLRRASGGLRTNKQTVVAQDVYRDRDTIDVIETGQDVSGSYAFEFSYGSFDDLVLAPALMGIWTADTLINGAVQRSLTFEEAVAGQAGATTYRRFLGCRPSALKLDFSARKPVTGSLDLVGSREMLDNAALPGATYPLSGTPPVMAGAMVGSLGVVGLAPSPVIRQISLQITTGLKIGHDVRSLYGQPVGTGRTTVTGSLVAYFTSGTLYQAVLDHAAGALAFTVGAASGQKYAFAMPSVRLLDGAMVMGGKNDDLIATVPFQALYSDSIGATISITRNVT